MARETPRRSGDIDAGAVPAEDLQQPFPRLSLPVRPPFPPMEAELVDEIPEGGGWLYEPKWDGFRCLAFKDGTEVVQFPQLCRLYQNSSDRIRIGLPYQNRIITVRVDRQKDAG